MSETFTIRKGDDFHCHFRTGNILKSVAKHTAAQFKRAVAMPNTIPPVLTAQNAADYRNEIRWACPELEALMTVQINSGTTPEMIEEGYNSVVVAGKVYPQGVTTNSENGVSDFKAIYPALEKMQELGMPLLLHGEDPWEKVVCFSREKMFLPTFYGIACDFPRLKIVLEHISTEDAAGFIARMPGNVAATITVHHLMLTIDDVVGGLIQPHNFCKPIVKMPQDREALLKAATSGNPKFFFGSDSAPHRKEKKECSHGCAGVFSAPVAMPLLVQLFEERDALNKLEDFVSKFGADFYGLPQNNETITLSRQDWEVREAHNGIVPFMEGETMHWKVHD